MSSSNSYVSQRIQQQQQQTEHLNGGTNYHSTSNGSPHSTVFLAKVIEQQQAIAATIDADSEEQSTANGHNLNGAPTEREPTADDKISDVPLLFVEQNDVITIDQQQFKGDNEWFLARSDQQIGRIPKRSCSILDDQIPTTLCRYLIDNQYFNLNICFASFVAQDVGDLSMTKGDIIVAIVSVNEHWMQGQVCFDSQANTWPTLSLGKQVGTFPLNHCWQLDTERVRSFCYSRVERDNKQPQINYRSSTSSSIASQTQIPGWSVATNTQPPSYNIATTKKPFLSVAHSSSLSSGSSSLYSADYNQQASGRNDSNKQKQQQQQQQHNQFCDDPFQQQIDRVDSNKSSSNSNKPPPRPNQLPRQISERQKSSSERAVSKPASILTSRQHDKLKGWIHTVKKKTARLSTRITASLGLISLTRDEEFERHYDSFKQLEKSIRVFIKNLTQFVDHFENFLVALQNTSDNLAKFYRDKPHQREINEMRKKNKALNCEHFHAFKRTVDRQVIAVASQLLQKFAGPHQLVHKRSAKLLDYDTKTKEMESCRDLEKKATLREDYVIAKELYDRINVQLIEELPLFNQFALDIFRECILVLLESRRNLMLAYTQQTANLLDTPLMASYTASDVASTIMMSCELAPQHQQTLPPPPLPPPPHPATAANSRLSSDYKQSGSSSRSISNHDFRTISEYGTQPSGSSTSGAHELHDELSRPQSAMSRLSSEFDQMAMAAREISSTPLSQNMAGREGDDDLSDTEHQNGMVRFDEPDAGGSDGSSDNKHNENIESTIEASRSAHNKLSSTPVSKSDRISRNLDDVDGGDGNRNRKRKIRHPIYVASWPFMATGPNQLSIACNQQLKLIKGCDECGNSDWSLVKDKRGHLGYVPSTYIKKKD